MIPAASVGSRPTVARSRGQLHRLTPRVGAGSRVRARRSAGDSTRSESSAAARLPRVQVKAAALGSALSEQTRPLRAILLVLVSEARVGHRARPSLTAPRALGACTSSQIAAATACFARAQELQAKKPGEQFVSPIETGRQAPVWVPRGAPHDAVFHHLAETGRVGHAEYHFLGGAHRFAEVDPNGGVSLAPAEEKKDKARLGPCSTCIYVRWLAE